MTWIIEYSTCLSGWSWSDPIAVHLNWVDYTYNFIKQNWLQFLLFVKVTALKQQIAEFYPQIHRTAVGVEILLPVIPTGKPLLSLSSKNFDFN